MSSVFASLPVNPFEADVIREPREVTFSVQGLNDGALNHLIAEFQRLTVGELPRSPIPPPKAQLVVSPEAGYGKSHLLGRLFQAVGPRATQIYLLPFQAPERAWQSILLAAVQELDRPSQHELREETQLDAFAMGVLAHIAADFMVNGGVKDHVSLEREIEHLRNHPLSFLGRDRPNGGLVDWLKARITSRLDAIKLANLLKTRGVDLQGREKAWLQVLAGYAFSEKDSVERFAALSWIRGDPLESEEAAALGLSAGDNDGAVDATALAINAMSLRRLHGLCALSSYTRPFLFCFDQTEVYGSDKGLAEALGNCISHMYAGLPNHLTIVTTNATNWTADILPHMKPADQARFSDEIRLEGIEQDQSRMLLAKRLEDFQLDDGVVEQFVDAAWLLSLFRAQPFIGVRHLLVRAAARFRELGRSHAPSDEPEPPPRPPAIGEAFAVEVNKVRAKPALHQYNQDCLMWFTQVLSNGFDGVTVKKAKNRYFSTHWEWEDRAVYFAFEGGDNNGRWRAMAQEAVELAAGGRKCAIVFRTPDLKPIPGPRWVAARQTIDRACQHGLRIERLSLDEVCELHAARELYSNALQGNVDFAPAEVLAWLKARFRSWFERYSSVTDRPTAKLPPEPPRPPKSPRGKSPTSNPSESEAPAAPARLSEIQLRRVVDHMKERLLDDINEVLKALGAPSLREALLVEVEKHPNLKAHPGPQTIYLQWRIA
jgi:hypothetical protein